MAPAGSYLNVNHFYAALYVEDHITSLAYFCTTSGCPSVSCIPITQQRKPKIAGQVVCVTSNRWSNGFEIKRSKVSSEGRLTLRQEMCHNFRRNGRTNPSVPCRQHWATCWPTLPTVCSDQLSLLSSADRKLVVAYLPWAIEWRSSVADW